MGKSQVHFKHETPLMPWRSQDLGEQLNATAGLVNADGPVETFNGNNRAFANLYLNQHLVL